MKPPTSPPRAILRVYLAAPLADAPNVRELGATLDAQGFNVTSKWAHGGSGLEPLDTTPIGEVRRVALSNDRDLLGANLVIALARDGAGAEMFAEVRLALVHRIPVLWVGARRPLSAYREGVFRAASLDDAKLLLTGFSEIAGGLPPFETRKARETLWDVIEGMQHADGANARRRRPVEVA